MTIKMKTMISAVIFQVILYSVIYTQTSGWYFQNPKPTNMGLNSVKFLTTNEVIAVGYYGTVIKSTNAGLTWSNPVTTTAVTGLENLIFWNTSFINPATGYIVGNNAGSYTKVFKTTNSGYYWYNISTHQSTGESIQFLNESTGWVTAGLHIYKTIDGGINWDSNSVPMPSMVRGIYFDDSMYGYACLNRRIYKTSNGGVDWQMIDSINVDFTNLYFQNINTGFVAGSGSIIRKTIDGGLTWQTKLSNVQTGTLSSFFFINSQTGFAVGGGFYGPPGCIYKTTDSGESWVLSEFDSKYHINSISASGSNLVAVGYGGKVFKSSDMGSVWSESPSFQVPTHSFYSASFINENTGWVTTGYSDLGIIYRTSNGGSTWQQIYSMGNLLADKLQFFNASTGYYLSTNVVFKTSNGGHNWVQMPELSINANNCNISFNDVNTGFAYGYIGSSYYHSRILKTTNGAISWDTIKSIYENCTIVRTAKFINNYTGWISVSYCTYPPPGFISKIFKTTNSGLIWNEQRNDTGIVYENMDFKTSTTGWLSGGNKILTTFDGGNSWSNQQFPGNIKIIEMLNSNIGWIYLWGFGGRLLKTTNSGLNWSIQLDLGLTGVNDFNFVNENTGWAVGSEGMILKTTNGGELVPLNIIHSEVPKEFLLRQNYPNPFNPFTKLKFLLPFSGITSLKVYDVLGREIRILVNQHLSSGSYEVDFNGSNLPSGVYYYKIAVETSQRDVFTETKKMVLLK